MEHVAALVDVFQDPVLRHWTSSAVENEGDAMQWVRGQERGWAAGDRFGFAVLEAQPDSPQPQLVGHVVLKEVASGKPSAEVGCWTAAHARGRGVAPRALEALTWLMDEAGAGSGHLARSHAPDRSGSPARPVVGGTGRPAMRRRGCPSGERRHRERSRHRWRPSPRRGSRSAADPLTDHSSIHAGARGTPMTAATVNIEDLRALIAGALETEPEEVTDEGHFTDELDRLAADARDLDPRGECVQRPGDRRGHQRCQYPC